MLDWVERSLADRRVRLAADAGLAVVLTAAALVDITDHEEIAHAVSFGRGSVLGRYFISDGKTEIAPPAGVPANSSAKAF
jgi:hypothetical protein